jgi:uncharacterized membrane protein YidH (DUF202 family)
LSVPPEADPSRENETRDAARRTRLANERTFLAWWRTGLTALAVCVALGRIVPGVSVGEANPHCTHVVASAVGYARNLAVVASGDVVIAIGGEWGTLSEIGHARNLGRTVVALRSWGLTGRQRMEGAPGVTQV